jgi:prepilin-type N-terminal cleavage/methylation domain-containing protein
MQPRAFSLLELVAVVAIVGVVAFAACLRLGSTTTAVCEAERTTYQIAGALRAARRAAISTGDNHYVRFNRTSGVVVDYQVVREALGGESVVDQPFAIPRDVTITTASDSWEFAFDGSVAGATSASIIRIDAPEMFWTITVQHGTGTVRVAKSINP